MAKAKKAELIEDMVDDDPATGVDYASVMTKSPPAVDQFPFGFLVKHPSFGSLRVRKDQAQTEDEAIEVYRQTKCPGMRADILAAGGVRVGVLAFRPAETERGK